MSTVHFCAAIYTDRTADGASSLDYLGSGFRWHNIDHLGIAGLVARVWLPCSYYLQHAYTKQMVPPGVAASPPAALSAAVAAPLARQKPRGRP